MWGNYFLYINAPYLTVDSLVMGQCFNPPGDGPVNEV
jgi:hypothetical protein